MLHMSMSFWEPAWWNRLSSGLHWGVEGSSLNGENVLKEKWSLRTSECKKISRRVWRQRKKLENCFNISSQATPGRDDQKETRFHPSDILVKYHGCFLFTERSSKSEDIINSINQLCISKLSYHTGSWLHRWLHKLKVLLCLLLIH